LPTDADRPPVETGGARGIGRPTSRRAVPAGEIDMSDARTYLEVVQRLREIGLMDDHALLAETTQLFLGDAARMVVAMKEGQAKGDANAVGRAAHRLKGAALNLGAAAVAAPAREIEERARRGDRSDVANLIATIEREVRCVGDFLRDLSRAGTPL
jgi:HPt (histidine-containing phosphotransfer) domain-containing protein